METTSEKYALDCSIKNGVAKGFRLTLTEQCLEIHKSEHGDRRPELFDPKFINQDVPDAVKNHDSVYPSLYENSSGEVKPKKNVYVFYKENINRSFTFNGKEIRYYVRVIARKVFFKKLEIISPLYSVRINEKNRCQPITKI